MITINVEQSPLTITQSNSEHIYTLSSTGSTLPNFKYIIDVYFKPEGLDEELHSRLKVAPNSYGRAIMDVSEIIRTFLNANPRFDGSTYPFLNLVANENSIITLADAQKTRDYNAYNLSSPGVPSSTLNQLWHIAQYRCVVGCEYTSNGVIITDIDPDASFQPDYITIFPGVDNSLIPEPYLPYGTLGSGYTGSPNFYQMDNQGWYYYNLFRHVYQKSDAKECRSYYYYNSTNEPVNVSYVDCDNNPIDITINGYTIEEFCALAGTPVIDGGNNCNSYIVTNNDAFSTFVDYTDCDGNSMTILLNPGKTSTFCALDGTVSSVSPITIDNIGPCGCGVCGNFTVENPTSSPASISYIPCTDPASPENITVLNPFTTINLCVEDGSPMSLDNPGVVINRNGGCGCTCMTYIINNFTGNDESIRFTNCVDKQSDDMVIPANSTQTICALGGTLVYNNLNVINVGDCGSCICTDYTILNQSSTETAGVSWLDCDNIPQSQLLNPGEIISICACQGTITSLQQVEITDFGSCGGGCVCIGYSVFNPSIGSTARVTWTDCNNVAQSTILSPLQGLSFCACEDTVTSFDLVDITESGPCGECVCKSYSVVNNGFDTTTINFTDCDNEPRTISLGSEQTTTICACDGSISSLSPITITDLGECGERDELVDEGICEGYNPVKPCPGPQELLNAAGRTECIAVDADGKTFTNVRRRMHHRDCPMIVSFLNGKNDYFTNDVYSIAVRGALNQGDPYTYSAECENRETIGLPLTEEPVNSTFKMLNFYLPYNITSGETLNAIPTNAEKVCFYGTSYNPEQNNRLNMASATTEILEYYIQPKDCINEPVHILFMNGRGMWDTYTFGKKNTKKITLERKKYQQETSLDKTLYARGSSDRGQKIYEQNATYSWDCNTWFMDEADTTIMEEIFMSQDVFIITGTTISNQECQSELDGLKLYQHLIPVVVKQNDFTVYQQQYQKIYQYNLTLDFGSVKRMRTQG